MVKNKENIVKKKLHHHILDFFGLYNGNGREDDIHQIDKADVNGKEKIDNIKSESPNERNLKMNNVIGLSSNLTISLEDELTRCYKTGEEDGKNFGNPNDGLKMIEAYYNYLIRSEEQTRQSLISESLSAYKSAEFLENEIEILIKETNEQAENSKASLLRKEINDLKAKIEQHRQSQFNDDFLKEYTKINEKHQESILGLIEELKYESKEAKQEFKELVDEAKSVIRKEIINGNYAEKNANKHIKQKLTAIENGFLNVIELWKKIRQKSFESTFSKYYESINKLEILAANIKKGSTIPVPSEFRVISNLIIFIIVLIGEIFLIHTFTSVTLKMDSIAYSKGLSRIVLSCAVWIFCIAYPLSIGMLAKFYITGFENRGEAIKKVLRFLIPVVFLLVFSIALLNPLEAIKVINNKSSTIELLKFIAYMIAFFGITSLFSVVSGMIYVNMVDEYELLKNAKKISLFKGLFGGDKDENEDTFIKNYENEIQKKENEISRVALT